MSERENNVYKAKLAEQAERYDGKYVGCLKFYHIWIVSLKIQSWFINLGCGLKAEKWTSKTRGSSIPLVTKTTDASIRSS